MKLLVSIIVTALAAFALGLFFDWWTIALAAFVVACLIHQKNLFAFLSGFGGIFLLWFLHAVILNSANDGVLGGRIAQVLPLGGSTFLLILFGAVVGGLVGGLSALSGSMLRKLLIASR
jgi:hypothetical protein